MHKSKTWHKKWQHKAKNLLIQNKPKTWSKRAIPIVTERYKTASMRLGWILSLGGKYPDAAETKVSNFLIAKFTVCEVLLALPVGLAHVTR